MIKRIVFQIYLKISNWLPNFIKSRLKLSSFIKKLDYSDVNEWLMAAQDRQNKPKELHHVLGVNVIGIFRTNRGISESARLLVKAFGAVSIPTSLVNVDLTIPKDQITETVPLTQQGFKYDVNVFSVNPPEMISIYNLSGSSNMVKGLNIGQWYWELENIPEAWNFAFEVVDEIWAASSFIQHNFQRKTKKPVHVIPPCIQAEVDPQSSRADFGLPNDKYLFMSAYDCYSSLERKNPLSAIRAFKKAFSQASNVGLVLKINNGKFFPDQIKTLLREMDEAENIYLLDQSLSRIEMYSLINQIDSYLSLHRSEGFGLIPAEAMSLGKPVIMTSWSGNTDLMTGDNCLGVGYKLVPLREDHGLYKRGEIWAEPDEDHAVDCMRSIVAHPSQALQMGRIARQTIQDHFSPSAVGNRIKRRFNEIGIRSDEQMKLEETQKMDGVEKRREIIF